MKSLLLGVMCGAAVVLAGCSTLLTKENNIIDVRMSGLAVGGPSLRSSIEAHLLDLGFEDMTEAVQQALARLPQQTDSKVLLAFTKARGAGPQPVRNRVIDCVVMEDPKGILVRLIEKTPADDLSRTTEILAEQIMADLKTKFPDNRVSLERQVTRDAIFSP